MKIRPIPEDIIVPFLIRWEGIILHPYKDVAGHLTIGIGHLILPHERFGNEITKEEAIDLLMRDLRRIALSVCRLITVPLTDTQYSALLSFTFNLGGAALQRSTLRSCLNRGEYLIAADEFPKWCWAGGRRIRGLYLRRLAERDLFLEGI